MDKLVKQWIREQRPSEYLDEPYFTQTIASMSSTNTFYKFKHGRKYRDEDRITHPGKFTKYKWYLKQGNRNMLHADVGPAVYTILNSSKSIVDGHYYKFGVCTDALGPEENDNPSETLNFILSNKMDNPVAAKRLVQLGAVVNEEILTDAVHADSVKIFDFLLPQVVLNGDGADAKEEYEELLDRLLFTAVPESVGIVDYFLTTGICDCDAISTTLETKGVTCTWFVTILDKAVNMAKRKKKSAKADALVKCLTQWILQNEVIEQKLIEKDMHEVYAFLIRRGGLKGINTESFELARTLGRTEIVDLFEDNDLQVNASI